MKFTETLCDLGSAVPSVLSDIVSHGAGASALECIRKLACKGMRDVLADPPPALLHPSKLAFTNLLYGARKPCPLRDGPYFSVSDKAFCEGAFAGVCVGGLCIDVTADKCCSAVVFARPIEAERRLEIVLHVYGAPLAAMETELFNGVGAPSAFEREWLAERAVVDRKVRAQAGQYVRTRGMDEVPSWLHTDKYAIERPGALVLLRARLPATPVEKDDLRATLERETLPVGGAVSLKDLLNQFGPERVRVTLSSVFHARPLSDKPERTPVASTATKDQDGAPDGVEGCAGAIEFSVVGPLALLVLKHMSVEDFYGGEAGEAKGWEPAHEEGEEVDEVDENEEADDTEALLAALDRVDAPADNCEPADVRHALDTPMRLLAATLRPCDVKLIVRSSVPVDVGRAVANNFLSAEVGAPTWTRVDALLQSHTCESVLAAITCVASTLAARHAILLIEKSTDGRVGSCCLLACNGVWNVPLDAITRCVLFPWLIPLIFDGTALSEIQVQAVTRESMRAPAQAPASLGPPAPRTGVGEDLNPATPCLTAVVAELREAAAELKAAAFHAAMAAPTVDTEITRSLKRTIAYLEV